MLHDFPCKDFTCIEWVYYQSSRNIVEIVNGILVTNILDLSMAIRSPADKDIVISPSLIFIILFFFSIFLKLQETRWLVMVTVVLFLTLID